MKCCILPPRDIYHPVLPFRCNNKLLFCLRMTCAIEQNTNECTHQTVAETALIGTWVMDEIRSAFQKAYRLIEVFEVYEYQVTKHDSTTGQGGLFVEYINTFLKLKAEASGYSSWVRAHEYEDSYINMLKAREGILLDRNAIRPKAAKRAVAKLCLNSIWGKLTERNHRSKPELISDRQEIKGFLATPGIDVVNLLFASHQVAWVSWKYTEEKRIPNLRNTNEVVGSFVTVGARIHLYAYVDKFKY